MRQLLPHPADAVDVDAAYAVARPVLEGRPWTVGLMTATADGAATVAGVSGSIGGAGDKAVFRAVRAAVDAIVVGAATVTAERYHPVRADAEAVGARTARGQAPHPTLVVVSGRLSLAPDHPALGEGRAIVAHGPTAPAARVAAFAGAADLVALPASEGGGVDVGALLATLHARGHRVVEVEGGPTLNGAFVAADLLDELCLTLDPMVVGGTAPRIVTGTGTGTPRSWRTAHLLTHDDALFWRTVRNRGDA